MIEQMSLQLNVAITEKVCIICSEKKMISLVKFGNFPKCPMDSRNSHFGQHHSLLVCFMPFDSNLMILNSESKKMEWKKLMETGQNQAKNKTEHWPRAYIGSNFKTLSSLVIHLKYSNRK